jgi:protein ImuB
MFACLYSLSMPVAALVKLAEDFTPRFEVVGPVVMLDVSGLSGLFGSPRDIGEQLRRSAGGPVRIAIAPTQTAAALLALGRPGLTVIADGEQREALAPLPVSLLVDFDRLRLTGEAGAPSPVTRVAPGPVQPPNVAEMEDVLPYFQSSLGRTSDAAAAPHRAAPTGGGWMHPRDSHAAAQARRTRRAVTAPREMEHAHAAGSRQSSVVSGQASVASGQSSAHSALRTTHSHSALRTEHSALMTLQDTLRRWGVKTLGALAALPPGDVYERLGARGVLWQRLTRGEDLNPLVPWVPEDPFEGALDLEWPIEGLEPLSFVLGRLLEPLSERLERADRGAAILHTHLRLVDKTVHARTLQLPAPMRDPKTLRTLILLDLESNPPSAAIDRVRLLAEPTPARVTQWALFERARPSPEQVSTLLARLAALMGERHVGAPQLIDSWKPGAFDMQPFAVPAVAREELPASFGETSPAVAHAGLHASFGEALPKRLDSRESGSAALSTDHSHSALNTEHSHSALSTPHSALRRFRLPVPARVQVHEGRPIKIMTDRRGISGGQVVQAAGPWRTSGEWWNDAPQQSQPRPSYQTNPTHQPYPTHWDRDEWDVAIADGTIYRIYVEREIGQWFLEGIVD